MVLFKEAWKQHASVWMMLCINLRQAMAIKLVKSMFYPTSQIFCLCMLIFEQKPMWTHWCDYKTTDTGNKSENRFFFPKKWLYGSGKKCNVI